MTNPNKSTLFRRKVRNQVLKNNNNRRIGYMPQYYVFDYVGHSDYTFLNDLFTAICKKDKSRRCNLRFYGPKDYPWENDTKYCFFDPTYREYWEPTYVFPRNWLRQYDPDILIFIADWSTYYMDLEKRKKVSSEPYLIRDRFHTNDLVCYPTPGEATPYSLRKGDEDWCITYLNFHLLCMSNIYFQSFLLIKNIDFSELDAKVKADRAKCPVPYIESIKFKNNPQIRTTGCSWTDWHNVCLCVNCRKDYRAFEVELYVNDNSFNLHLNRPFN